MRSWLGQPEVNSAAFRLVVRAAACSCRRDSTVLIGAECGPAALFLDLIWRKVL